MLETHLHAALHARIGRGNLRITFPSGRVEAYGDGSGPALQVRIADRAAVRRIVLDPTLAVPELYMDGRL
ncbi:MAG TPA: SAM-dependent methyltransferase, partial [Amaricoccus sp.]|nr:SAM-dependent methyltransferase [Amaricoccus sp.]